MENLGWIAGVPWRSRQRQTRVGGGCQGENFPRQVSCKSCKVCILKLTPNEDMERQEGAGESVDIESKCHTHTQLYALELCKHECDGFLSEAEVAALKEGGEATPSTIFSHSCNQNHVQLERLIA